MSSRGQKATAVEYGQLGRPPTIKVAGATLTLKHWMPTNTATSRHIWPKGSKWHSSGGEMTVDKVIRCAHVSIEII